METILIFIGIAIVVYVLFKLNKLDVKLDEATTSIDNPYSSSTMSLDNYEKELNDFFDYDKVNNSIRPSLDDSVIENINLTDEDVDEIINKK